MKPEPSEGRRSYVLDASALLAMLHGEPGGETVQHLLESAAMSAVNWSEVVQKALDRQVNVEGLRQDIEALGLAIIPFSAAHAEQTAHLRALTRQSGLSLGDRACLALAAELGLPAITTDRAWNDLPVEVGIQVVRPE